MRLLRYAGPFVSKQKDKIKLKKIFNFKFQYIQAHQNIILPAFGAKLLILHPPGLC